jgi:hypothetical protein
MLKRTKKSDPLSDLFGPEPPHVKLEAWRIHNRTIRIRYFAGIVGAVLLKLGSTYWPG